MSSIKQALGAIGSRVASSSLGRVLHRAVFALSSMLFFCPVVLRTGNSPAASLPRYTYTGVSTLIDDGDGNWRIKFLTSGTLQFARSAYIDAFLVGGGGGGGQANPATGGGGGYTNKIAYHMTAGTAYDVVVGAGGADSSSGGTTSAFEANALGGYPGLAGANGGNGGSGGGAGGYGTDAGNGGSNGGNGGANSGGQPGGAGQGTTTREFHDASGDLYAGAGGGSCLGKASNSGGYAGAGGGGVGAYINGGRQATAGAVNTGGGGGAGLGEGGYIGRSGGSGIVVIRNQRAA